MDSVVIIGDKDFISNKFKMYVILGDLRDPT